MMTRLLLLLMLPMSAMAQNGESLLFWDDSRIEFEIVGDPAPAEPTEATVECRYGEKVEEGYRDGTVINAECVAADNTEWFLVLTTRDEGIFRSSKDYPPGIGMSIVPMPYPTHDDCKGAGKWWGWHYEARDARGYNSGDYTFHCIPRMSDG